MEESDVAPKSERSNLEALGSFTQGWQDLDGAIPGDEQGRAEQEAARAGLREELAQILNSDNLVIVAGLGTSLGIRNSANNTRVAPRMSDLWDDVVQLPSFPAAKAHLNDGLLAQKNLEHVLSDAQARLALDKSNTALQTFLNDAEAVVWHRCNFIDEKSLLGSHEVFLRKVARRSVRLQRTQLFTTNYDLAFETAAERARFSVIDGFGYGGREFDGSSFDLDYVRRRPNEPLALEPNVFHLLKLHGSVDWNLSGGQSVRKVFEGSQPANPVLIYPSAAKYQLSYQQPYLEFMSRFQIALRQPDIGLIVVGFGFNDDHVVAPIESAMRSNIGLRALIVGPGLRDQDRSPSIDWIESLVDQGDRRLGLLKGTFDDLVKLLPDAPRREERDAHADRIDAARRA